MPFIDHTTIHIIDSLYLLFSSSNQSNSGMSKINELRWFLSEGLMVWCLDLLQYMIKENEWEKVRERLKKCFQNVAHQHGSATNGGTTTADNDSSPSSTSSAHGSTNDTTNTTNGTSTDASDTKFLERRLSHFKCIHELKHLRWKEYVECIYGLLGLLERLASIDESYALKMINGDVVNIVLPYLEGAVTFLEMRAATGLVCALAQNPIIRKHVFKVEVVRRMYFFLEYIPQIIEYEFMLKPKTRLSYHRRILSSTMQDYDVSASKKFKEYHLESVTATSILVSWRGDVVVYFNIFLSVKSTRASAYVVRYCPEFICKSLDTINLLPTSRTMSTVTECLVALSSHKLGRRFLLKSRDSIDMISYGSRCSGYCQQHCMMALYNLLTNSEGDSIPRVLNLFSNVWPVVTEYDESDHLGFKMVKFIIRFLKNNPSQAAQFNDNHGLQYVYKYYRRLKKEKKMPKQEQNQSKVEAEKLHEQGNQKFIAGQFEDAAALYEQALEICPIVFATPRMKSLGNLASCKFKLHQYEDVVTYCTRALNLCTPINNNPKYVHRRHQAFEKMEQTGFASQDYHYFLFLSHKDLHSDTDEDIEKCATISKNERDRRAILLNRTVKQFVFHCMKQESDQQEIERFTDTDFGSG